MSIHPSVYAGPVNPDVAHRKVVVVRKVGDDRWVEFSYEEEPSLYSARKWKTAWGPLPKPNNKFLALTAGPGFGFGTMYFIRGLMRLDGTLIYFKTPGQIKADIKHEQKRQEVKARKHFAQHRQAYLDRMEKLHYDVLSERMNRGILEEGFEAWFQEPMGGAYELFVCEQAQSLADHVLEQYRQMECPPDCRDRANYAEKWFKDFRESSYDHQRALWPDMDDGHSGNTFGWSVNLAHNIVRTALPS